MCNPPSKIIDAKISKRQEVQKEKHKRQKETHHRRSPWVAPAAVRRQLRELTRRLSQLTEMMTQEKNRAGHLPFAGEVEESSTPDVPL